MTSMAFLVALALTPQTATPQASTAMQDDVNRLVRAAEALTGTWRSQPPPPIAEVDLVARHGRPVAAYRYYAAHLLGDLKDSRGVDLLVPLLKDPEAEYVVPWSLAEIGDRRAIAPLIERLDSGGSSAKVLAILALEKLDATEALPKLRELLQDDRPSTFGGLTTVAEAARHAIAVLTRAR